MRCHVIVRDTTGMTYTIYQYKRVGELDRSTLRIHVLSTLLPLDWHADPTQTSSLLDLIHSNLTLGK